MLQKSGKKQDTASWEFVFIFFISLFTNSRFLDVIHLRCFCSLMASVDSAAAESSMGVFKGVADVWPQKESQETSLSIIIPPGK